MKLYRLLLRLFPARFREEYEAPMEHLFSDEYRDATGVWSRTRLWSRAIGDVIVSAPQQRLSELTLDLSHAARIYRKHLFSTMLALTAMALAIGASTGVFSVLSAVLLRSLPFADPEELTRLWLPPVSALSGRAAFSDWYRHSAYLANAAAISPSEMNLTGEREAFRVKVAETSSNFFRLLGTNSVIGRTFAPDEDIPGHNEV